METQLLFLSLFLCFCLPQKHKEATTRKKAKQEKKQVDKWLLEEHLLLNRIFASVLVIFGNQETMVSKSVHVDVYVQ